MNIVIGTLVLMGLAAWVWQSLDAPAQRSEAVAGMWRIAAVTLPRVVIALISAGLFAELLPEEMVRAYLGDTSGFQGVLLGSALGVVTPGGVFVSFALAAGAVEAGAAMPATIAYVTAWSLFALTRIIADELALMGKQFLLQRIAVTLPIPLAVGGIAMALPFG